MDTGGLPALALPSEVSQVLSAELPEVQSGVMGMFNRTSAELPWVGNKDGGDMLTASSSKGWIGLYF